MGESDAETYSRVLTGPTPLRQPNHCFTAGQYRLFPQVACFLGKPESREWSSTWIAA
jgi:hypothetical protein